MLPLLGFDQREARFKALGIIITLPLGTEVYCAPVRAKVHDSKKAAASAGFDQREAASNEVGMNEQLNR